MALLDFLKQKKKKEEKPKQLKKEAIASKEVKKPEEKEAKKIELKGTGKYGGIILKPHITEKSSYSGKFRQYFFKVNSQANKNLVKKAVEDIYNVNVIDVKIINIPSKTKRLGRTTGKKSGYKKAIVKLKEGEVIEIMPT